MKQSFVFLELHGMSSMKKKYTGETGGVILQGNTNNVKLMINYDVKLNYGHEHTLKLYPWSTRNLCLLVEYAISCVS